MAIELEYISEQFQQWEGRKLQAYIPCYVKPEAQIRIGRKTRNYTGINGDPADCTVMGASGVTVGTGCDLGQQTLDGLRRMGVPESLLERFALYIGLSRDAALHALYDAPFTITESECDALDRAVHAYYVRRVARLYDLASAVPFADIPREAQAVIAHLFYHLGNFTKYPKTWEVLTTQDWRTASMKLQDGSLWSGPYDHGRASEGKLLEQIPGVRT